MIRYLRLDRADKSLKYNPDLSTNLFNVPESRCYYIQQHTSIVGHHFNAFKALKGCSRDKNRQALCGGAIKSLPLFNIKVSELLKHFVLNFFDVTLLIRSNNLH